MSTSPLTYAALFVLLCVNSRSEAQTSLQTELPQPSPSVLEAQEQRVRAMEDASRCTVSVYGVDGQGGGSGVCISADGYVLTNFHVSSPFGHRMKCSMNDGKMYESVVAGIDPTGDLAVVKMFGRDDFPVAKLGNSDEVRVGQWCFAAGNPFVLATNLQPTVTYGLISGVRRYQYPSGTILEYSDCIQTDAAINPGNSGGPLFNANGELIGINGRCSFEKRGRVNVGVGYAISIKQAMNFYWHLRSGRVVDHATLGFTVSTDSRGKVTVSNILESSDAYRRGLRFGDEVLKLGDREIATTNQLKNVLGIFPAQWRVPLRFRNETETIDTFVRLQNLHLPIELDEIVRGESSEMPKPPPRSPQDDPAPKKGDEGKKGEEGKDGNELEVLKLAQARQDPLADKFEAKRGFSNYYFNRFELDRIIRLQGIEIDKKETREAWNLRTEIVGEKSEVEILLEQESIRFKYFDKTEMIGPKTSWVPFIKQRSPACISLACKVRQRWYQQGPRRMGEAIFIGRNPLRGFETLMDTTRITLGEVDAVVYSMPDTGSMVCIELIADNQSDPAEVYFEKSAEIRGVSTPTQLRLVFGLENELALTIKDIDWQYDASKPTESSGGL